MSDKPSLLKEFQEFAIKGNVVDLAVGVIIGAAFGKIVTSAVNDLFMPLLGPVLAKGQDLNGKFIAIVFDGRHFDSIAAAKAANVATINYGLFLNNVIDFLIVAVIVFALVKAINTIRRKEAAAPSTPPAPTRTEELLTEIRDSLAAKSPVV